MFRDEINEDRVTAAIEKLADAFTVIANRQADPTIQAHTYDDMKRAIEAGHIIDAIRMFRAMTHSGLKEAKDVIDFLRGLK